MLIQVSFVLLQAIGFLFVILVLLLLVLILQTKYPESMEMKVATDKSPWVEEAPSQKESPAIGDLDRILDFALRYIAHSLTSTSSEQPVPGLNMTFPLSCGYFKVKCQFTAKEGIVEGFESLHRRGGASTNEGEGGALEMDATACLRYVRLRYCQYTLRLPGIEFTGTLEAQMSPVALRARLALSPPFDARLRSLSVAQAGALRVQATGLGVWSPLLTLAQRWLDSYMHDCLLSVATKHLELLVQNSLEHLTGTVNAIPPMLLFPNCVTPSIEAAQSREFSQEKEWEEQRKYEKRQNFKRERNSLSAFMISPYFGDPIEHHSTVPFRCHS